MNDWNDFIIRWEQAETLQRNQQRESEVNSAIIISHLPVCTFFLILLIFNQFIGLGFIVWFLYGYILDCSFMPCPYPHNYLIILYFNALSHSAVSGQKICVVASNTERHLTTIPARFTFMKKCIKTTFKCIFTIKQCTKNFIYIVFEWVSEWVSEWVGLTCQVGPHTCKNTYQLGTSGQVGHSLQCPIWHFFKMYRGW